MKKEEEYEETKVEQVEEKEEKVEEKEEQVEEKEEKVEEQEEKFDEKEEKVEEKEEKVEEQEEKVEEKKQNENYKCPICFEFYADPVKTPCAHYFCLDCSKKIMASGRSSCPMCRAYFDKAFVP